MRNDGDGALGNATLWFKEGNATFHDENLPLVEPGDELAVSAPWTVADDTHLLRVTVPDHEASILFTLRAGDETIDNDEDAVPVAETECETESESETETETEAPKADLEVPRSDPWTGDDQETPGASLLIAPLLVVGWLVVKRARLRHA